MFWKSSLCFPICISIILGPVPIILAPILYKIFLNNLLLLIKQANLHNYTDDNTIIYFSKFMSNLETTTQNESDEALTCKSKATG